MRVETQVHRGETMSQASQSSGRCRRQLHTADRPVIPIIKTYLLVYSGNKRVLQQDGQVVFVQIQNRKYTAGSQNSVRLPEHGSRNPLGRFVVDEANGGEIVFVGRLPRLLRGCMSKVHLEEAISRGRNEGGGGGELISCSP